MDDQKRAAEKPAEPKRSATDIIVDDWVREHMTNNIVSQTPGLYNEILKSVSVLKSRLNERAG